MVVGSNPTRTTKIFIGNSIVLIYKNKNNMGSRFINKWSESEDNFLKENLFKIGTFND